MSTPSVETRIHNRFGAVFVTLIERPKGKPVRKITARLTRDKAAQLRDELAKIVGRATLRESSLQPRLMVEDR